MLLRLEAVLTQNCKGFFRDSVYIYILVIHLLFSLPYQLLSIQSSIHSLVLGKRHNHQKNLQKHDTLLHQLYM